MYTAAMIADGKLIAAAIEGRVKNRLANTDQKKICFVMFGEHAASVQFVGMKTRVAERLGISVSVQEFSGNADTDTACELVASLAQEGFDGIVVQLPLPRHMDVQKVLDSVPARLDVDVLSTAAKNFFVREDSEIAPPVARAVIEILDYYDISLEEKEILIVGNGKLVGEPVATMISRNGIPFHVIDKNTPEEEKILRMKSADIIITGVGSPHMIKPEMIKEGAVLIDAGTSEQAGKLVGDIDPACAEIASLMTPVPGGVGPVTVACLFLNLVAK
ncbi:MAG: folD [Patescibacteria group bacterium]|nr:folD [Patescibacteria group bacterium]